MRVSIEKEKFLNALSVVGKAISTKPNLNTSGCILIDATKSYIRLLASNEDMAIQGIVEGEIIEEGMVGLDARQLTDLIRKIPEGFINVFYNEKEDGDAVNVLIESNNIKAVIPGKFGYLFSDLPEIERDVKLEISQYALKDIIRRTIFCTSLNSINKILEGELFVINNGILRVEAVEQSRVAIRQIEINNNDINEKLIIKGSGLNELIKIISDDTESFVDMYFMKDNVVFEFDNYIIVMRLLEGNFFDSSNLKYNDYITKVEVNKKSLYECLDRTTLFAKEGDKKSVKFVITNDNVNISVVSQYGSINENIEIFKEGEDIEISFNPKLFIDALKAIDDETVTIYLLGKKFPCFIRKEDTYNYVVLPILG
ncbi:MAG: DNA polymerase III subunit beta [Lachnospiraceae bacterium]|nr:DNA polymerase III subunit beta [Lachnospiraceae bacterium]